MYLPDPRAYPRVDPQQPVVRALMRALTDRGGEAEADLQQVLLDALQRGDDALLDDAFARMPSQDALLALRDALASCIETPIDANGRFVELFVLPLILVTGARKPATLPAEVPDLLALRALLVEHGLVDPSNQVWLSAQLTDLAGLASVPLSRWFDAAGTLAAASSGLQDGLPFDLPAAPIEAKSGESVHLRFLVGVAIREGERRRVKLGGDVGKWGLPLTKLIQQQWQQQDLTLFAMPRPLAGILSGRQPARFTCLEVAYQLFLSGIIRKVREAVGDPVAALASHEGNEIRVTVHSRIQTDLRESFVWRLAPDDVVASVQRMMEELLAECQVGEVHRVETVQPDRRPDGLPLFLGLEDEPVPLQ